MLKKGRDGITFCRACILKSLHQAGKTCPICREGVCSAELIAVEEETK